MLGIAQPDIVFATLCGRGKPDPFSVQVDGMKPPPIPTGQAPLRGHPDTARLLFEDSENLVGGKAIAFLIGHDLAIDQVVQSSRGADPDAAVPPTEDRTHQTL